MIKKNWKDNNQETRDKQIRNWAKYVRENDNWQEEHTKLINSIFEQSKIFYDNLLQSKEGVEIIVKNLILGIKL